MKAGMSWSAITLNGQVEKGIQLMNDPEAVAQMVSAQKSRFTETRWRSCMNLSAEKSRKETGFEQQRNPPGRVAGGISFLYNKAVYKKSIIKFYCHRQQEIKINRQPQAGTEKYRILL